MPGTRLLKVRFEMPEGVVVDGQAFGTFIIRQPTHPRGTPLPNPPLRPPGSST
jgi:hypothetical protein